MSAGTNLYRSSTAGNSREDATPQSLLPPWTVHRWTSERGEFILVVEPGTIRDVLLHAADLIERDGWAPFPEGQARGPRSLKVVLGDSAEAFSHEAGQDQLLMASREALLAAIEEGVRVDPESAPRNVDEFELPPCDAEAVCDLLRLAAWMAVPTSSNSDEE